jgi:hypothetical protein
MQTTSQTTQIVTVSELETILANTPMVDGMSKFAHITTLTKPNCLKNVRNTKPKVPFTDVVEKKSSYGIILNNEYKTAVTNQLDREGKAKTEYKAGQNTMPVDKSESKNNFFGYFEKKNGQILPVIELRPNKNAKQKPTVDYFVNGVKTDVNDIPDVLPKSYPAENQGTDKEIAWRKVYLANVVELSIDGVHYVVTR